MKKIFILYIFSIPFFCFSQIKSTYFDENWIQSTSRYNRDYICEYVVNEKGEINGAYQCYDIVSEQLLKTYHFKNNILDGEVKKFYADGSLKLHAFYSNGFATKTWKEWDSKGILVVEKQFDENNKLILKPDSKLTEYEKMYFGEIEFQPPVFSTECIIKTILKEKNTCSDKAMLTYYSHPPLPPSYFSNSNFSQQTFVVVVKYQLNSIGKITEVKIITSSGDDFLDDLAKTHILNMIPFEAAKSYESPINYWINAEIVFKF